jgi:hypothetical protein
VSIKDQLLKASRREDAEDVMRYAFSKFPANALDIVVDADDIRASFEIPINEISRILVTEN